MARARDWVAADPDPLTRAELDDLLDQADGGDPAALADLVDRFSADLQFGTAGLRGALGAGPNRMNLAVVTRAANGIVGWLQEAGHDAASRGVAVCFDARHRSRDFAERSAGVFAAAGIRAHLLPGPLPTPVLAFAVRHLGAAAGVMVTASHNPPQDNGYKVYDATGRQIVAPVDAVIAEGIAATGSAAEVACAGLDGPDIVHLGDELVAAYVEGASRVGACPVPDRCAPPTAMHGVGGATVRRVAAAAGFEPFVEVADQVEPDPDFRRSVLPEPRGARCARSRPRHGAHLRRRPPPRQRSRCRPARCRRARSGAAGGWRALRGDEIGAILAHHLLAHGAL
ncbi:MAG: hypothetical protein R2701_04355 [Acidimicrobiales bacterium]